MCRRRLLYDVEFLDDAFDEGEDSEEEGELPEQESEDELVEEFTYSDGISTDVPPSGDLLCDDDDDAADHFEGSPPPPPSPADALGGATGAASKRPAAAMSNAGRNHVPKNGKPGCMLARRSCARRSGQVYGKRRHIFATA